jgi:pilus assembly protein CpaC
MSKIPILGDIPILGALFRSTQDDVTEKELVFCITPRLTTPTPRGTKPELPTDKPIAPSDERDMKWIPTYIN